MHRRQFLIESTLAAGGLLTGIRGAGAAQTPAGDARLVVIMLRGAVDGLNVVVPHGDPAYYERRPTIAVAPPGSAGGAIDLDGHFGMHPAMAALEPLWRAGRLAFVHASGSPDTTRSHFDAQAFMESGTPGDRSTPDGWMNRLLQALPGEHRSTEAVSLGPTLPRIMSGSASVANIATGRRAERPMPLDRPRIAAAFDRLYAGDDPLARAYREGIAARGQVLADLRGDMEMSSNGAPSAVGFAADARKLARLMRGGSGVRLGFAALGGWDTHVNQGAAQGQLARHLKPLADGLGVFAAELGPLFERTVVVVLSEFGRTAHENGNGGTDHGHGNVMWVLGGPVRGGRVYGEWPGLATDALYEGRDLAVTTDFRVVIAALLERHLRLGDEALARVFPGMPAGAQDLQRMLTA